MRLNPDVWYEIISYFEYPKDVDTLRSLALTALTPSDLALDVMWRDGGGPLAIVSVINSFATSQDEPFLEYTDSYGEDRAEKSDGEESHTRAHTRARNMVEATWVRLCPFGPYLEF